MKPEFSLARLPLLVSGALITLGLGACGGGGGSSTPQTSTSTTLSISGTAASATSTESGGVTTPLATKTVTAKCAAGSNTQTTGTDGAFTVTVSNATLPCILEAPVDSSTTLHSAVTAASTSGSTATATANITPITEMIVAAATGTAPATLAANFDSAAQAKLTSTALTTATTSVKTVLTSAGATVNDASPITTTYSATSSADVAAVQTALTNAQTTTAAISSGLAAGGSTAAVSQALQPASPTCSYLHTGDFTTFQVATHNLPRSLHLDAVTLAGTYSDATALQLTPVNGSPCAFSSADGTLVRIGPSGIIATLTPVSGGYHAGFGVPKQDIPLSELAGQWNGLSINTETGLPPYNSWSFTMTLDSAGKITDAQNCGSTGPCTPFTYFLNLPAMTTHPNGGYQIVTTDDASRVLPHKTASGRLAIFNINMDDGSFVMMAPVRALSLPATTDAPTAYTRVTLDANGIATQSSDVSTIHSVDTASNSYTRILSSSPTVISTQQLDTPRTGMRFQPNAATTTSGSATTVNQNLLLPIPGTGITSYLNLTNTAQVLGFSINKP